MKIYRFDAVAFLATLFVMAVAVVSIPSHLPLVLRTATGFLVAVFVFGAYLMVRKPDVVIELEGSLHQTAQHAETIASVARQVRVSDTKGQLVEISQRIAHVATKCFTRNLASIEVHVRRLERVARNFATVLDVLTGNVVLARSQMTTAVAEIENEKIPGVLKALSDIEVSIDEVQAKKWLAAESDLEILTQAAELSSRAGQAAELLKRLISSESEVRHE